MISIHFIKLSEQFLSGCCFLCHKNICIYFLYIFRQFGFYEVFTLALSLPAETRAIGALGSPGSSEVRRVLDVQGVQAVA